MELSNKFKTNRENIIGDYDYDYNTRIWQQKHQLNDGKQKAHAKSTPPNTLKRDK